jgi:hypothetical protein
MAQAPAQPTLAQPTLPMAQAPASQPTAPSAAQAQGATPSSEAARETRTELRNRATGATLGEVIVRSANGDLGASLPGGVTVDVFGESVPERHMTTDPEQGALGGGAAVRIAPPVDLGLVAHDALSGQQVPLPEQVREETFLVSLPVLVAPSNPDDTFTWLIGVHEDGAFLGYMRYPSRYDADRGMLVFEMPARVLQNTTVLPVILQPSWVQTFLPQTHVWSSPFRDAQDLGVSGDVWASYQVIAPQVGGRIGVLDPTSGALVWIDAFGVGPTGAGESTVVVASQSSVAPPEASIVASGDTVDLPALGSADGSS